MMYWNRIWVIPAVVMSHVNIYSAIVNVSFFLWFFFLCVLLSHCWSDCLHLQRSGSISVSVLLFLPCFECSVDSAAKPWCFISSHVTYTWFFFFPALPLQHPQCLPHIYSSSGLCKMLDAWDFFESRRLCNAYSGLPFPGRKHGTSDKTNSTLDMSKRTLPTKGAHFP